VIYLTYHNHNHKPQYKYQTTNKKMIINCQHCDSDQVQISAVNVTIGEYCLDIDSEELTLNKDKHDDGTVDISLWCDNCGTTSVISIANQEGLVELVGIV
jgi:hypothetical protein